MLSLNSMRFLFKPERLSSITVGIDDIQAEMKPFAKKNVKLFIIH